MRRVFLISNRWDYEAESYTVMFSDKKPTQEEAHQYLIKATGLEGYDMNKANTKIEEYVDNE